MSPNVRIAIAFYGPMIGVSVVFLAWRDGRTFFDPLPWVDVLCALAVGLTLAFLTVLFSEHSARSYAWAQALKDELLDVLGPLTTFECLALAAASGVGEELLFRGCLLPPLGLLGSSLVFGLVHFPIRPALRPWTIFATVMGLALGFVYQGTGSLWAPIAAHAAINGINLYQLSREPPRPPDDPAP